MTEREKERK